MGRAGEGVAKRGARCAGGRGGSGRAHDTQATFSVTMCLRADTQAKRDALEAKLTYYEGRTMGRNGTENGGMSGELPAAARRRASAARLFNS